MLGLVTQLRQSRGFSSTLLALEGTAPHHLFDVGVFGQGLLLPWSTLS